MKRILIGLIALAVLGAGGWFGFDLYARHRATQEIEAVFDKIRSQGGKASHGKVAFAVTSRTLTIEDIAVDPAGQPQAHIKIAGIKGVGVRQADESRFAADSIEISSFEVALDEVGPGKLKTSYKVPQMIVRDYAGPVHAQNAPASGSLIDLYRCVLDQYASVTASSIAAPTLTVAFDAGKGAAGSGEVVYSGLAIQKLGKGKVDAMKADRATFTINVEQAGKADKLTGEMSDIIINEFDSTAIAAALDPQKASDDSYHRVYGQMSSGTYVATSTQGMRIQVDGIAIADIAVRPSKFRPAEILALLQTDRSIQPTPAQSREMMEKLAGLYEGLRVGKIEIGTMSMTTPQGTPRLRAIRYQEGEFALEGLDAPTPQGQVKMERFALKSLSLANLMRWAASLTTPGQAPSPDQMLGLFGVLSGAEVKGVAAPYKNTKKLVTIDTLSLDWGQLVGSIPSKAHVVAKFVTPTDPSDPRQLPLVLSGIDRLAIDLDLGAAWTESSKGFALTPATLDVGGIAKAQLRITLGNVPRELFSADPAQFMGQAAQVEAVALEFSVRDNGLVDSAVTQNARGRNVSRDEARRTLVDSVRVYRADVAAANPEAGTAVDAIASFIETPGQTLVIKLTPRAKVPLMQLMQLFNADPEGTLAQFRIEASTGL
ncbi:hypothetical protein [Bradyrhizobium sp. CCBAU 11361]|uniref:hypothetical protein n=1 Tax=Bradyrhizobium sp. CCBAU 11361 TaxID=1630812 RepID=UPI002303C5FD|nr:hypothetical protein [Bradyrhizobium sp. CCBAU 11361]MDA9490689.1 hypothetical protein [Bradyrhizobium sp. CCBAU 11361]